jgi:hypothetical protein
MGDNATPTQSDRVRVEPATYGVGLAGEQPNGHSATFIIPWDQAVVVSRRILQLARNRGDVS